MNIVIDDHYPADAAHGVDYLSGNMQGDVIVDTPDGPFTRKEKILITDREVEFEGRVCVGERTIRHLAHQFGMIDEWRADLVAADNLELRSQLTCLSEEFGRDRADRRRLAEIERPDVEKVYIAADGTEHDSSRAAIERTAQVFDLEPAMIANLTVPTAAQPDPEPQGAES